MGILFKILSNTLTIADCEELHKSGYSVLCSAGQVVRCDKDDLLERNV